METETLTGGWSDEQTNCRIKMRRDPITVDQIAGRMVELLQQRNALSRDDLEYVVETVAKLKDERLKACIAELIGWGDDERSEVETFVAIAIEVMKRTNVSKLRECSRLVELRYLSKSTAKTA